MYPTKSHTHCRSNYILPAANYSTSNGRIHKRIKPSATAAPPLENATEKTAATWPSSAAREAAFTQVAQPSVRQVPADVRGRFPGWLSGNYFRNGPGTYQNGTAKGMDHMFDGYGLLVKLQIVGASNTVTGSHEYVQSNAYKEFQKTGKQRWREFATAAPADSFQGYLRDVLQTVMGAAGIGEGYTDNACVNVLPVSEDSVIACTETVTGTYMIDANTLQTLERVNYSDNLKGDLTTAHPSLIPGTAGDQINILNAVGFGFFQVFKLAKGSTKREPIATIRQRRISGAWVHDFPCSERYVVIPETPLYFNLGSMITGKNTDHIFLDWSPEDGTLLHVADLTRKECVRVYKAPPFYAFHYANAWQEGDTLVFDASVYTDPQIVNDLLLDKLRSGPTGEEVSPSQLMRMSIDLTSEEGSMVEGWMPLTHSLATFEFPAINPKWRGRKNSIVWGTCAVRPSNAANALCKVDVNTGETWIWNEPGVLAGEPVFVPRPDSVEEDDGVLLAVLVQSDGKAALVALDGKEHQEVARAILPYTLTIGFHGCWVGSS